MKMTEKSILALLLCAFISSANISLAQSKAQLKGENEVLKEKLDSLTSLVQRYELNLQESQARLEEALRREEEASRKALPNAANSMEATDSLLSRWYMMGSGEDEDVELENVDSILFNSDVPDSVYIQRIKDMNCFIQLAYNDVVRNYIILYSKKYSRNMGRLLGLCEFYMPSIRECFNRYGLPEELAMMALIESHLNPQATSRAGAKGMWQFMYPTAKKYGLTINSFVDERMDVSKSTDAAARYLRDAYKIFGDWNLAISSYNCGAGNVRKAIARSGGKTGFWDIYPYLPRETRGYVPAFVGALYATHYHKEHGIEVQPAGLPVHVDTFHVNKMLHFKQLHDVVGVSEEELRKLNPQYPHDIVPGNQRIYVLRLPHEYTQRYIEFEDSVYRYQADTLFSPVNIKKIEDGATGSGERIVYTVKSGDTLGHIAARYHTNVKALQRWNNLKTTNLRIGQKIYIYPGRR